MTELTFVLLRFAFLALLWIFIFGIVYALRSDLFGAPARRMRGRKQRNTPQVPSFTAPTQQLAQPEPQTPHTQLSHEEELPSAGSAAAARVLVITSGVASGTEIPLDDDVLTIGRSPDSTLVIVDEYTSTYHAKLTRTVAGWQLSDLDSTNGTLVDDRQISGTVQLPIFTPVTIGKTTFELRP